MSGYVPTPAEAKLVDDMARFMGTAPDDTEPFAHEAEALAIEQDLLGGAR